MLRLDTQYTIKNANHAEIYKVVTLQDLIHLGESTCAGEVSLNNILLWADDDLHHLKSKVNDLEIGGIISHDRNFSLPGYEKILLEIPKDPNVVSPGDVIAISPSSKVVRVLYRRGSNSNLLFMTDRCNSYCLMCSQPPKDINDEWHVDENLHLIDLIDTGEEQLGISGGEPTLYRHGLLDIIKKCKSVVPEKHIHILSNGRLLSDRTWINDLVKIDHNKVTWGIPLYADNAQDHDYVVQAPGAFTETMQGIYNLALAKQSIEIRVVLSNLTVHRLPELAYFVFRNMPFIDHIAFMGIESMGLAKNNYDKLWIDPVDYQEKLSQACHYLDIRGISASVYNLPLCLLNKSLFPFYRQSISDWKNIFVDSCQPCKAHDYCAGFFKSHSTRWESRGISPMNELDVQEYLGGEYEPN